MVGRVEQGQDFHLGDKFNVQCPTKQSLCL